MQCDIHLENIKNHVTTIKNIFCLASPNRQKRDTTCAFGGRTVCNYRCKATGYAEGDCAWNTETGAFNCECSQEKRGIRYF